MITNARSDSSLKKRMGPFKVLVTLVTLWFFLFSLVSYDFAWAARTPLELTGVGSNRAGSPDSPGLNINTFALPEYLGQVRSSFKANSDKIVIHIQDAHCNYAAQQKIAEIIEYLNKEHGIGTINLEGGAKGYDLSVFTNIYDKAIREKTADYFVKEGLVNGAEYFAINNPEKATLWGVEDAKLYVDNLNIYRESLKHKDEVDKHLNTLTHILNNFKTKIYSQELLDLDAKYTQYKAESIEFKDYLAYLIQTAKLKLIDIKSFTSIYLLSQTLVEEGNVDFKKANNERDELIDKLTKKLSSKAREEFVSRTVEFKSEKISQKDFYAYIVKKCDYVGIGLKDYPDLQKYIVYISMYNAIDKTKIMEEIEMLENKIKETMYQNDKQRELNRLSKNLAILKNIFGIFLTKEDYKYYIDNEQFFNVANYVSFINKEAPFYKITAQLDKDVINLDRYRESIVKFYEYSFKRDNLFLKNIKFDTNQKIAIIVTGGFHTENLCDIFKKNNISYISIMPSFSNYNGYKCPYFKLLAGEMPGLDKKLYSVLIKATSASSTIQIASWLNGLGDEVWGRANIDALSALCFIENKMNAENLELTGISDKELTFNDRITGATVTMTIGAILDQVHQKAKDKEWAKGYENGFKAVSLDLRREAADRIREMAREVEGKGEKAKAGILRTLADQVEKGPLNINLVNCDQNFEDEEHAGGMGIHINNTKLNRLDEKDRQQKVLDLIVHAAIGTIVGDHRIASLAEDAGKINDTAAAITGKEVTLLEQNQWVWNIASPEERLAMAEKRDFAQATPTNINPVTGRSMITDVISVEEAMRKAPSDVVDEWKKLLENSVELGDYLVSGITIIIESGLRTGKSEDEITKEVLERVSYSKYVRVLREYKSKGQLKYISMPDGKQVRVAYKYIGGQPVEVDIGRIEQEAVEILKPYIAAFIHGVVNESQASRSVSAGGVPLPMPNMANPVANGTAIDEPIFKPSITDSIKNAKNGKSALNNFAGVVNEIISLGSKHGVNDDFMEMLEDATTDIQNVSADDIVRKLYDLLESFANFYRNDSTKREFVRAVEEAMNILAHDILERHFDLIVVPLKEGSDLPEDEGEALYVYDGKEYRFDNLIKTVLPAAENMEGKSVIGRIYKAPYLALSPDKKVAKVVKGTVEEKIIPVTETSSAVPDTQEELLPVDSANSRDAINADAWKSVGMSDLKVVTLVGVEDRAKAQPVLHEINDDLKTNGFNNDRNDNQQVVPFNIVRNDDGTINMQETKKNMYGAIDNNYREGTILAVFAPQLEKSELENDAELKAKCDNRSIIVIPDSYSDSSLNPDVIKAKERGQKVNTFIDIKTRVIIARLFAFCRQREIIAGKEDPDSLNVLKDHIMRVSDNKDLAGANNLKELLKKLNEVALRIRPIDYKDITDWQKSQEATGISA